MRTYGNIWSRIASGLMGWSHMRAPALRWGVLVALAAVWIWAGYTGFMAQFAQEGPGSEPTSEAVYRTLGAIASSDVFFAPKNIWLEVARFAGLAVPVIGIAFAFSGELGRSLAQVFFAGARGHIVIAGDDPPAISLAQDCQRRKDSVVLIGARFTEETAWTLRRLGVTVVEGDGRHIETLRAARAHRAAHVVAFECEDSANLQIEAAMRRLLQATRTKNLVHVHVSTRAPMLLKEAREMGAHAMRRHSKMSEKAKTEKRRAPRMTIDAKPFSLDEMAARDLVQKETATLLALTETLKQDRLHIAVFGYDDAGDAVAARLMMSVWSAALAPPRVTFLTPEPEADEARFRARYPEAFAHPQLWIADIAFMAFDWTKAPADHALIRRVQEQRGQPTALIVAAGADTANIQLALALKRVCNQGFVWPVPIYMKEASRSEFSEEYAKGDDTEELDAYLQAFGSHQVIATRARIIEGRLDRGAAIAHEHYNRGVAQHDAMSLKELQAAMRDWADVLETYRAANRAASDGAVVKMWDLGWRPAAAGERGDTAPTATPESLRALAEAEHARWMAERLMSGWKPGAQRSNDLMVHNQLIAWSQLSEAEIQKDVDQVRAAIDIARLLHPRGFVRRAVAAAPAQGEAASAA